MITTELGSWRGRVGRGCASSVTGSRIISRSLHIFQVLGRLQQHPLKSCSKVVHCDLPPVLRLPTCHESSQWRPFSGRAGAEARARPRAIQVRCGIPGRCPELRLRGVAQGPRIRIGELLGRAVLARSGHRKDNSGFDQSWERFPQCTFPGHHRETWSETCDNDLHASVRLSRGAGLGWRASGGQAAWGAWGSDREPWDAHCGIAFD